MFKDCSVNTERVFEEKFDALAISKNVMQKLRSPVRIK